MFFKSCYIYKWLNIFVICSKIYSIVFVNVKIFGFKIWKWGYFVVLFLFDIYDIMFEIFGVFKFKGRLFLILYY